jgi:hypothetical protein
MLATNQALRLESASSAWKLIGSYEKVYVAKNEFMPNAATLNDIRCLQNHSPESI